MSSRCSDWITRFPSWVLAMVFIAIAGTFRVSGQTSDWSRLTLHFPGPDGLIRLDSEGTSNRVYRLLAAPDLSNWLAVATLHHGLVQFPDFTMANEPRRFYRLALSPITETDDWKHQIHFPGDRFLSTQFGLGLDEIRWVKFAIVLSDPVHVIYQDSRKHLFHHDFATQRLAPFMGMSPAQFDLVSLHAANQQVLLGAVLYPSPPNNAEFGIQLVGLDPYPREMVREVFERVRATVAAPPGVGAFYIPTFEQSASAKVNLEWFATNGIPVSTTARWLLGSQCYAPGWAVGRLRFVPGDEINAAYADGRLGPGDILLTDGVPAEIPFVAGVMTLTPSTPNSHVAILSRSFGIPFVYLASMGDQLRAQELVGRKVGLRVKDGFNGCDVKLIDLENVLTPDLEAEILQLKSPPEIQISPIETFGAYSAPVDALEPSDIRYFGGKAANSGFLRRAIPDNSPAAIAFSFDLWEGFMDQTMPGGMTLRAMITDQLAFHTYPPDVARLRNDLADIREMIAITAQFTPSQEMAITNALGIFDPGRKIRFRSSTNAEDTEEVSGAGLYDSVSGCLMDDMDGDTAGPSHCDDDWEQERGVFRAMKQVYASFYNDNAFMERLRLGIRETDVGMALLAHHSFPDTEELANGVAAMDVAASATPIRLSGDMVTQAGALPVTNPDGSAVAEVVVASMYSFGTFFNVKQGSSLVPLGDRVLDWEEDYLGFVNLFTAVAEDYAEAFPAKQRFVLDFEYKKMAPDDLVVKQVREIPLPDTTGMQTAFLLNESNRFCVFQGEAADVFANHRLKSRWRLSSKSIRLAETNLQESFYLDADWEYIEGEQLSQQVGAPSTWANASYSLDANLATDRWSTGSGAARRDFTLETHLQRVVPVSDPPLLTLSDMTFYLWASYATPQASLDYLGQPTLITNEVAVLVPCPEAGPGSLLQHRSFTNGSVLIQTSFYWPPEPTGIVAGYTAPLVAWVETTIHGLTSEPVVLRGDYSQTYRPGHHNFTEEFIFEPQLEPGIDPGALTELEARDIRWVHVVWGQANAPMRVMGLDGLLRVFK